VTEYQIYAVDAEGHIHSPPKIIECDNDHLAIDRKVAPGHLPRLTWHRENLLSEVGVLDGSLD
jgi:hypothetical protein